MTDLDTQVRAKQPEHDEMDRLMAEFLADPKNQIQKLARGESAEIGWTAKQRVNPNEQTKASIQRQIDQAREREAKRAQSLARPTPRDVKEVKRRRDQPKGPLIWGDKTRQVLQLLEAGPMSATQIAEVMGATKPCTRTRLWQLRDRGMVVSKGDRNRMTWQIKRKCR